MRDLYFRVREYMRRHDLLHRQETVLVAVSGGPDSLCLLHLLLRLRGELDLQLHVAHLNHGLRGSEAAADARLVAAICSEWGIPCEIGRVDVRELASSPGVSLEEAGRLARYGFLAETAASVRATSVAVGHNANDQVETVLMHFLRGSGVAGLRGMLPRTPLPGDSRPGEFWLVRPLLETGRDEIEEYCSVHDLHPRFDHSNEDMTFFRNRLRHELLPLLESYNPSIRAALARTATVMQGEHELLHRDLDEAWRGIVRPAREDEITLDLAKWRALPIALQRASIRKSVRRLRGDLRNVSAEHVERALWVGREGGTGQRATIVGGLELRVGYESLRITEEGRPWLAEAPRIDQDMELAPGTTGIGGGWRVVVHRLRLPELGENWRSECDGWTACLDARAVGPRLLLRPRQPGERFVPQGFGGRSVTVKDFMINAKVRRDERATWPLLVGEHGIAWVCGLRVDERAAIRPETEEVWRVSFVRG